MHVGQTLFEGVIRDDKGRVLNPSFLDYKMATFLDIPGHHDFYSMEMPDPEGPFGAKEAGEGSATPTLAAIANAISDAIGVRITSLPITPEKIYMAIKGKG
jgi:4-hydroxybenzoyl-CoA reductase subunit alpha